MFFTVVNPGISLGGLFGESKKDIYALLPSDSYPTTLYVRLDEDMALVQGLVEDKGLSFPLILKPDIGERGLGVHVVHDFAHLEVLLADARQLGLGPQLIQAFCHDKEEYGLFFVKDPITEQAQVISITGKQFLTVIGDGESTVKQLLYRFWRGEAQASRIIASKPELMNQILRTGQELVLEPIGNHSRGTTFVDACHLRSSALDQAVTQLLSKGGAYYGRLDVKSPSAEALQAGVFTVVELNGVSSEPGHIYDPSHTAWFAWKTLLQNAAHIPLIAEALMAQGHKPATLTQVLDQLEGHFQVKFPRIRWVVRQFTLAH